jgi:hypothetical protein
MIFDKYVDIVIDGKTYKLCYPLRYVWEAERQLTDKNFMLLMANAAGGTPPNMGDIYTIFKYALMGGDPELKEADADELFLKALETTDLLTLSRAAMAALQKSGAFGKPKKEPAAEA